MKRQIKQLFITVSSTFRSVIDIPTDLIISKKNLLILSVVTRWRL